MFKLEAEIRTTLAAGVLFGAFLGCTPRQERQVTLATPTRVEQSIMPPQLGLAIDRVGWERVLQQGPRWGLLVNTPDKDKLECPSWSPGICLGRFSQNFLVAVNGPLAEFMFRQAQATNPIRPIKMIFVEDWIRADTGEYLAGGTNILDTEIHIAISLKALAWNTYQIMEANQTLRAEDADEHFEGTISWLTSRTTIHELGHGGAEPKRLGPLGKDLSIAEAVHPQIYTFEDEYVKLFDAAASRGLTASALIFGAQPIEGFNLLAYRDQIYREARERGIEREIVVD